MGWPGNKKSGESEASAWTSPFGLRKNQFSIDETQKYDCPPDHFKTVHKACSTLTKEENSSTFAPKLTSLGGSAVPDEAPDTSIGGQDGGTAEDADAQTGSGSAKDAGAEPSVGSKDGEGEQGGGWFGGWFGGGNDAEEPAPQEESSGWFGGFFDGWFGGGGEAAEGSDAGAEPSAPADDVDPAAEPSAAPDETPAEPAEEPADGPDDGEASAAPSAEAVSYKTGKESLSKKIKDVLNSKRRGAGRVINVDNEENEGEVSTCAYDRGEDPDAKFGPACPDNQKPSFFSFLGTSNGNGGGSSQPQKVSFFPSHNRRKVSFFKTVVCGCDH